MDHEGMRHFAAPVRLMNTGSCHDDLERPGQGIALCLSGGGYRAMLFHLGALWRLSELGYLKKISRISSVSGGSITAAVLGLHWSQLQFNDQGVAMRFKESVVAPLRNMASNTIDEGVVIGGLLTTSTIADRLADAYRTHLFNHATLQDLPADPPRFVINATNVQTGALFRFSRPYVADYRLGRILNPRIELAVAVAASSAYPPLLSPVRLEFAASEWVSSGNPVEDLHRPPYLTEVVLSDGGVYDNLGLETAWKRFDTLLVSNGGGKMSPEPEPKGDWIQHALRINDIIDNQVRSLRARQVVGAFQADERKGTYWGIRTAIGAYKITDSLPCPADRTLALAQTKTRLKAMEPTLQERLINWGYAVCDAAMRCYVTPHAEPPSNFPYPASAV